MHLDLLPYAAGLKRRAFAGRDMLWCPLRGSWLVTQPEELVRQALILFLVEAGYPKTLMQVERKVGRTRDLLDLLVYGRDHTAFLLVEVKAPGVKLQPAIEQLARYNRTFRAPFALAANGSEALCCRLDYQQQNIELLAALPPYPVP